MRNPVVAPDTKKGVLANVDWVTAALVLVLVISLWQGIRQGFARQTGYVLRQVMATVVGLTALVFAWRGSRQWIQMIQTPHRTALPDWVVPIVQSWSNTPGVAQAIVFVCIYLVVSACLHALLAPLPGWMVRAIPSRWAPSRWMGAVLGAVMGAIRAVAYGAVLFLCLPFLSWPWLTAQADDSPVYRMLENKVYQPWVKPVADRELPVLTRDALQPLAENISLFALPTGQGQAEGVLLVPQRISALAHQITAGSKTDRAKAYALYEWEIHHIRYDWQKYDDFVYRHQWDEQSPLQTLQTGKGVCADFALLYADMAHSVGLTVRIDEGMAGTGGEQGPHAWNEVWDSASQRWLTVDTTWGSQEDRWFNPPQFWTTHDATTVITIRAAIRS
ncbi:MAG: transglutaminase domain-containing protein [Thermoflavifilum sp.]|nr:transglutaminase domain-containing protein [Thermoflavifilum sp.]MCL6512924.1 CvpA family protein [Alicyclobacillus sp.]